MKQGVKEPVPEEVDRVATEIVDAAYCLHSAVGPGLLESIYETFMVHELSDRGLKVARQVAVPVTYKGLCVKAGLRLDLLVEDCVVVELKSVEGILLVHKAQLLSYLKLSGHRLGLLINFNVPIIKAGIHRIAN